MIAITLDALPFWPWLWADPCRDDPGTKREMAEKRLRVNYETARAPIPNQYALVHRGDLITQTHELWHKRAQAGLYREQRDRAEFLLAVALQCCANAQAPGEEFLEFKEALSDLRSLRHEYECLSGGGPGWAARNKAAWARVDELFANEDEAAYDRQQEDAHG